MYIEARKQERTYQREVCILSWECAVVDDMEHVRVAGNVRVIWSDNIESDGKGAASWGIVTRHRCHQSLWLVPVC